jgi:antirestriction protein ArdC
MSSLPTKLSVSDVIAERFISALEAGTAPWQKPWVSVLPQNAVRKTAYSGVNAFTLAFFGTDDYYLTFNQVKALNGKIEEGTKSLPIQYWSKVDPKKSKNGKEFMFAKFYKVFPLNKCGLPEFPRANKVIKFTPSEQAENLLSNNLVPVTFGGSSAHYTPALHTIAIPSKDSFRSVEKFYATIFHEIGHSLMPEAQRSLGSQGFGSEAYSKEELVAELFASLCLNHCGLLSDTTFEHNASYLANWLKALKNDKSLISKASTEAFRRFRAFVKVEATEAEESEA